MEYERLLSRYNYAELRIENGSESRATIKDDEIRHSIGSHYGASVRVLENGSWGFASSSSGEDVGILLEKAKKLATLASGKIGIPIPPMVKKEIIEHGEGSDEEAQMKALAELSRDMRGTGITSRNVSCSDAVIRKEFYNSHGSEILQESVYSFLSCSCIAKEGAVMQKGSDRSASRRGFSGLKLQETALEAKDKALRLLGAAAPPRGRFTVVFDHEMTGVFAHEALGHACEADAVVEKESILTDKMGKKIGNELVTVIDDPAADDFGALRVR